MSTSEVLRGAVVNTSEVLRAAWSAVEQAGLPEKVHEVAFREAVRLVAHPASTPTVPRQAGGVAYGAGGRGTSSASGQGDMPASGNDQSVTRIAMSEEDLVKKVAAGTGADEAALANLIHLDDGVLHFSVPGIKLGKSNADRTRTIAAVLTVVRSFALGEPGTSLELVREEAQRLKCYDSANFSAQLKALKGFVIKGSGNNRRIEAKPAGIAEFATLVNSLVSDS